MTTEPSQTDWSWVAGFFDGEGCVHWDAANGQLSLVVQQVSDLPMKKLTAITGIPHQGPFQRSVNQPVYRWGVYKNTEVRRILEGMWPYLTLKKEAAIERLALREEWKRQSDLRRIENRKQKLVEQEGIEFSNCTKCKVLKPTTAFNKNRSRLLGIDHYCKECKKDCVREIKEAS